MTALRLVYAVPQRYRSLRSERPPTTGNVHSPMPLEVSKIQRAIIIQRWQISVRQSSGVAMGNTDPAAWAFPLT
jgi:hypothetical protein